jgi:fido (protein-threonine AMPylation protein)
MRKKSDNLPEVFISTRETSKSIGRMLQAGGVRRIGPKLYTPNMRDTPEAIVMRNVWPIVGLLAPGTVVSHRTAFTNLPAPDGSLFVTGEYKRSIALPGITIRQVQGPSPVAGDMPYMGSLFLASRPRLMLENLLPSRRREKVAKTVSREELEWRLIEILRSGGENALNKLRDDARTIAPALGMDDQYRILDGLIAALLRSRPVDLISPVARAYAAGEPYDPTRLPTFDALFSSLRLGTWPDTRDRSSEPHHFHNAAFFDAYFSNYIEGTEFPIDQAIRIVFEGERPANRPADTHDVLGTYRLVASRDEMRRIPSDFDDFVTLLKRRHATLLEARKDSLPGQFKRQNNQAGSTVFVPPDLVTGTLRQGYKMYQALDAPFARALFIMFLVAEVHPFVDGNGRMARVMMNAELIAQGQTRIFIPSVYRNEYLSSLKRLTNNHDAGAYLRVMEYAQVFVSRIDFTDLETARQVLAMHNAFHDPTDDARLALPPDPPVG